MPATAFQHFQDDLARARTIIAHADTLPQGSALEQRLRSDLLRSAWMFGVGTLNAYLRFRLHLCPCRAGRPGYFSTRTEIHTAFAPSSEPSTLVRTSTNKRGNAHIYDPVNSICTGASEASSPSHTRWDTLPGRMSRGQNHCQGPCGGLP